MLSNYSLLLLQASLLVNSISLSFDLLKLWISVAFHLVSEFLFSVLSRMLVTVNKVKFLQRKTSLVKSWPCSECWSPCITLSLHHENIMTSADGPLKVLDVQEQQENFRRWKSQGTNTKIDYLMKKSVFENKSHCITYQFLFFTGRTSIQKF